MEKGLVQRVPCPRDRRRWYAELTEAGREKIEAIFPQHAVTICKAVSGLSAEEQETLCALLKKLGLTAKAISNEGAPAQTPPVTHHSEETRGH